MIYPGSEKNNVDLSIVIVNWNTKELLKGCIQSIKDSSPSIKYEVIVVDNGSNDGSSNMVVTGFPGVGLISNNDNKGFGTANNQGIAISHGRYILCLNSDTILKTECLDKMVLFMDSHQDVGLAGCRIIDSEGRNVPSCGRVLSFCEFLLISVIHVPYRITKYLFRPEIFDPVTAQAVDVIMGCFLFFRRNAIVEIGGFDENIFLYTEEADIAIRLKKHGWKVFFYPDAQIVHLWHGSNKDWDLIQKHIRRSVFYYIRKHYGQIKYYIALLSFLISRAVFLDKIFKLMRVFSRIGKR